MSALGSCGLATVLVAALALVSCTDLSEGSDDATAGIACPDADTAAAAIVAAPRIDDSLRLSRVGTIRCSDGWALVEADFFDGSEDSDGNPMANTYPVILRLESGRWGYRSRDEACPSEQIPDEDLRELACESS